jgi:hypothetical protein
MVRSDGKAGGLFLPTVTNVFIRGKPSAGCESLGAVVCHQEGGEVLLQVLMGLVIGCFHRGMLERAMHALHLAMGPGMIGLGPPMGAGVFLTHACTEVCEGSCLLLPMGQLDAMVGEHGVAWVSHGSDAMAQELCCDSRDGLRVQLGIGALRRAGNGDTQGALAVFGTPFGHSDVAVADRLGLERFLLWRGALDGGQAADGVPLHTTVECGSRQVRKARLPGRQAISQRQQRLPAKRHAQRLLCLLQYRGMRLFRPHRGSMASCPFLPWRAGLGSEVLPCGQLR